MKKRKKVTEYDLNKIKWVDDFKEGLCWFCVRVEMTDFYGFFNRNFELIIMPIFEKVKSFSQGLAPFLKDKSWGFINKKGGEKIRPQFYDVLFLLLQYHIQE